MLLSVHSMVVHPQQRNAEAISSTLKLRSGTRIDFPDSLLRQLGE
jgi:hypothetical protein